MRRLTLLACQILVGVAAFALWHVLSTVPRGDLVGWVPGMAAPAGSPQAAAKPFLDPFFFSTPIDVVVRTWRDVVSGVLWWHLWITLQETILAFVIGALGGVLAGFWLARRPFLAAVFDPYLKAINAMPRVVLAPIFALWLGLGIWSKVALGVTLVFFIVFFNVYQGVREVPQVVLANARMLGMSERQLMRHVYWPAALTWMFSSLHTAVGFALVGAVVGEYLGSAAGLGYRIQQAEGVFDVTGVFSGMLVLAVFVILIDAMVSVVERRLLVWRPEPIAATA